MVRLVGLARLEQAETLEVSGGPTTFVLSITLTRVDLVTQPVAYLVFGQYMLLDIIYVCCDCIMGIWLLFGRVAVFLDYEYIWRCVDESGLGTDCETVIR